MFLGEIMNKKIIRFVLMTLGVIISATGTYCFAIKAGVPVIGVFGITTILYRLYGLPMGILNVCINFPIVLFSYKTLGKKYLIRSAYCMLLFSLFTDYVLCYAPVYEGDRLLSAICCGLVAAIGDAIIYMCNSSTGGTDFLTISIKVKQPQLNIGTINLVQAGFMILLNGYLFKDIDGMIYGLIMNYISSKVVNSMILGFNHSKMMLIVTSEGDKVCEAIHNSIERGTTIFGAKGGYTQENKNVILCACSAKEVFEAEHFIKKIDPNCFIILLDSNEIHGNGFSIIQYGEENG